MFHVDEEEQIGPFRTNNTAIDHEIKDKTLLRLQELSKIEKAKVNERISNIFF